MSLALDEPKWVALLSNPSTTYEHAPQVERKYLCCMQTTNENHRGPAPDESPSELKDNSNLTFAFACIFLIQKNMSWSRMLTC